MLSSGQCEFGRGITSFLSSAIQQATKFVTSEQVQEVLLIISKITSKSHTTIPKAVRAALNLKEGDELVYRIEDGKVTLTRREARPFGDQPLHSLSGTARPIGRPMHDSDLGNVNRRLSPTRTPPRPLRRGCPSNGSERGDGPALSIRVGELMMIGPGNIPYPNIPVTRRTASRNSHSRAPSCAIRHRAAPSRIPSGPN
jgi:antitoxin PrlF